MPGGTHGKFLAASYEVQILSPGRMSRTQIYLNIERPDFVNKELQGRRGPFAPIIMALQTLVGINLWQLRQKNYPLLYESGIYYKTIPPARQWYDIPLMLKIGYGDCKNLVAYRIAELKHYYNIDAKPCIKWKFVTHDSKGVKLYDNDGDPLTILLIHVMVLYPNGRIEDPSKILGMGGEYS